MSRPDTTRPAAILRWIADELEAGRVILEQLDVTAEREATPDEPQSGARIRLDARALTMPPSSPACRAVYQRRGEHVTRVCRLARGHAGDHDGPPPRAGGRS